MALFADFSADGERMVFWTGTGIMRLWNVAASVVIGEPMEHESPVTGAMFSADGKRILSWGKFGMRVWNGETAQPVGQSLQRGVGIRHAAITRMGGES